MAALGFDVSAESFYALGARLPISLGADQRYALATNMRPAQVEEQLAQAILGGVIPGVPNVSAAHAAAQVARRLVALGSDGATDRSMTVAQHPEVTGLLTDWLGYQGDDAGLWAYLLGLTAPHQATNAKAQVLLVLGALTGWDVGPPSLNGLYTALTAQVPLPDADAIAGITAAGWTAFFTAHPEYLPAATVQGSIPERTAAFLRFLATFYAVVATAGGPGMPPAAGHPALLDRAGFDPVAAFAAVAGYTFDQPLAGPEATAATVFPGDPQAQAWLVQAVTVVHALWTLTAGVVPAAEPNADALRFALVEGLYARGFTSAEDVAALSAGEFGAALTGTVAYRPAWAAKIWANANGQPPPAPDAGGFRPVNADGHLVDCVPPPESSPFGRVEYLAELLRAGLGSTCQAIADPDPTTSFGALLAARRGDPGMLRADRATLETPVPALDIVNECLEHLAAAVAAGTNPPGGGVVHDTEPDNLAGHPLAGPDAHDPAALFAALPQYASPAVPVAEPDAYAALATDFSAPGLPYDQPLDVCRSYLHELGGSRWDTMRRFRTEITEFVLQPADQAPGADPAGFDATRWRYPLRPEIAYEYLGISAAEARLLYETPIALSGPAAADALLLRTLYGFPDDTVPDPAGGDGGLSWLDVVVALPEFLDRSGLDYCEFLDLWRSGLVPFTRAEDAEAGFDECPPCCPDQVHLAFPGLDALAGLAGLAVAVRLWRRLRDRPGAGYTFAQLADIAGVLGLFSAPGVVNPGFGRQLAAFQLLRDTLGVPLGDGPAPDGATGVARTPLLALWAGAGATPRWRWAVDALLDRLGGRATRVYSCGPRTPEFRRVLAENLDALSLLAGFDPATPTDTWSATPTRTLRFVEVLAKLYASPFTVGEVVLLLTADDHLDGDDPFPLPGADGAADDPFELPDDEHAHSLWRLRRDLLAVEVDDGEVEGWTWRRIDACLRTEFGYAAPAGTADPLTSFATHFFPHVLAAQGHPVPPAARRYSTPLDPASTSPHMWNAQTDSPFRYDQAADGTSGELWIHLPLRDRAVLDALADFRQLGTEERQAVQELYFQPRAALVELGLLLPDLAAAERHLIEEPDEERRWDWLVRAFLLARARCRVVARHLARHVDAVGDHDAEDGPAEERAWRLLRALAADENRPADGAPWEDDSGAAPALTWTGSLVGRAVQAVLGLSGTGQLTEVTAGPGLQWRDVSGPLAAFGAVRDRWNAPLPTLVPALDLAASAGQAPHGVVRNGIGFANDDGRRVGGAEGFEVTWSGALLVEHGGSYTFRAALPGGDDDRDQDHRHHPHGEWRFDLRRGQRTWTVLEHHHHDRAAEVTLRRGVYEIEVTFTRPTPELRDPEYTGRATTGFEIRYAGPDTGGDQVALPHDRLFLTTKDGPLGPWPRGKQQIGPVAPAARGYLAGRYTATLRDIRRTYQRAFKAVLLAGRFDLDAIPARDTGQSELGHLLDHPDRFAGTAYYRDAGVFAQHLAGFDLDFLPVLDPYRPPTPARDDRVEPSRQRRQAMADWWERIFDYTRLRRDNREAVRPPLWLLFQDAAALDPDDTVPLTPHMDVDVDHLALVTTFLGRDPLTAGDLRDERWTQRVWAAEVWAQRVRRRAGGAPVGGLHPFLWVADDPSTAPPGPPTPPGPSGNADLTGFVQDACLERRPRRYRDLQDLNDGLRERARAALLAYLCGMGRVPLPAGWATPFARRPADLSDLLLVDVLAGRRERIRRIDDGIGAVHTLAQRIRLGQEPPLAVTAEFERLWEGTFADFRTWQACRRRSLYAEDWVEWAELERARHQEGFRFLETVLRERGLSTPVPAGLQAWTGTVPAPAAPGLPVLQVDTPSTLTVPTDTGLAPPAAAAVPTEGFGLLGTPAAGGSPSWVAALPPAPAPPPPPPPVGVVAEPVVEVRAAAAVFGGGGPARRPLPAGRRGRCPGRVGAAHPPRPAGPRRRLPRQRVLRRLRRGASADRGRVLVLAGRRRPPRPAGHPGRRPRGERPADRHRLGGPDPRAVAAGVAGDTGGHAALVPGPRRRVRARAAVRRRGGRHRRGHARAARPGRGLAGVPDRQGAGAADVRRRTVGDLRLATPVRRVGPGPRLPLRPGRRRRGRAAAGADAGHPDGVRRAAGVPLLRVRDAGRAAGARVGVRSGGGRRRGAARRVPAG
ncbi:MAG: neuraminidase-like domain-containing protein, partial [Frankia sp.]